MQSFTIVIQGAGAKDGVWRNVKASSPSVALKRVFDGGHEANYKFATVGPNRLKMDKGQRVIVQIDRFA